MTAVRLAELRRLFNRRHTAPAVDEYWPEEFGELLDEVERLRSAPVFLVMKDNGDGADEFDSAWGDREAAEVRAMELYRLVSPASTAVFACNLNGGPLVWLGTFANPDGGRPYWNRRGP